jgi:hypothetical protein
MTKEPEEIKVTKDELATGDVYKRFGRITRAAREARRDLGELPIVYVTNRDERTAAIVPAWLAEWVEANAKAVLEAIAIAAQNTD